jgi:hypothetical protein
LSRGTSVQPGIEAGTLGSRPFSRVHRSRANRSAWPAPDAQTTALLDASSSARAASGSGTCYAERSGIHIAYRTFGAGPLDIVIILGFVSHVERVWDEMQAVRVEAGRYLAAATGDARLVELDGGDHWPWVGATSAASSRR